MIQVPFNTRHWLVLGNYHLGIDPGNQVVVDEMASYTIRIPRVSRDVEALRTWTMDIREILSRNDPPEEPTNEVDENVRRMIMRNGWREERMMGVSVIRTREECIAHGTITLDPPPPEQITLRFPPGEPMEVVAITSAADLPEMPSEPSPLRDAIRQALDASIADIDALTVRAVEHARRYADAHAHEPPYTNHRTSFLAAPPSRAKIWIAQKSRIWLPKVSVSPAPWPNEIVLTDRNTFQTLYQNVWYGESRLNPDSMEAINSFTRNRMREDGFFHRIMPREPLPARAFERELAANGINLSGEEGPEGLPGPQGPPGPPLVRRGPVIMSSSIVDAEF